MATAEVGDRTGSLQLEEEAPPAATGCGKSKKGGSTDGWVRAVGQEGDRCRKVLLFLF